MRNHEVHITIEQGVVSVSGFWFDYDDNLIKNSRSAVVNANNLPNILVGIANLGYDLYTNEVTPSFVHYIAKKQ